MIETFLVERAWQLLKPNGRAAIILPQSILNLEKYENLRRFLFKNFKINAMLLTSDITFLGTTTSPVVLFLTKQNCTNLNYDTMLIFSDKYYNISTKKTDEERFLGYKFSSDRNKSGTEELRGESKLKKIQPLLHQYLCNGNLEHEIPEELKQNIFITKLEDIILDTSDGKQIFPKYKKIEGKALAEDSSIQINPETSADVDKLEYVEISSIKGNKIVPSKKKKDNYRICLKDDILFSSLVPSSEKIIIADKAYKVSKAIYIIRINDDNLREKILEELKKDYAINQAHSLLEGFKLTYSKIKEEKFKKYIKLSI